MEPWESGHRLTAIHHGLDTRWSSQASATGTRSEATHRSKQKSCTCDHRWYRNILSLLLVCYYEMLDANAVSPLRDEPASLSTLGMVAQSSNRYYLNSLLSRVSSRIKRRPKTQACKTNHCLHNCSITDQIGMDNKLEVVSGKSSALGCGINAFVAPGSCRCSKDISRLLKVSRELQKQLLNFVEHIDNPTSPSR